MSTNTGFILPVSCKSSAMWPQEPRLAVLLQSGVLDKVHMASMLVEMAQRCFMEYLTTRTSFEAGSCPEAAWQKQSGSNRAISPPDEQGSGSPAFEECGEDVDTFDTLLAGATIEKSCTSTGASFMVAP
jgi:hypothetical protein